MNVNKKDILITDNSGFLPTSDSKSFVHEYTKSDHEIVMHNFITKECIDGIECGSEEVEKLQKEGYTELDASIYPAIITLNQKGYRTSFCCGGHFITFPLFYLDYDEITDEKLKVYKKNDLLHPLNYITSDDLYICFDIETANNKKKAKFAKNLMPYIFSSKYLEFSKSVNSYLYYDNNEILGGKELVREEYKQTYKLHASFYDQVLSLYANELWIDYENKYSKMTKRDITKVVKEKIEPARLQFEGWALNVRNYLDFIANNIEPLE